MPPIPVPFQCIAGKCLHQLRLFFVALQFFTRLAVPRWVGFAPEWLQQASRYFPAVGIVVGVITAGVYLVSSYIWGPLVAVPLSIAAGIYLTGALHEDGFADTCDGFGGGSTPDKVLEIMQDSRIGSYGAIGITLLLGMKSVVLFSLPVQAVPSALLLGHPLSRLLAAGVMWRLEYVRPEGKAKPLAVRLSTAEMLIALVSAILPAMVVIFLGGATWIGVSAGIGIAVLATLWMARLFLRRLGGYTGDCLGAVQQVSEVAFYLGLLAAVAR